MKRPRVLAYYFPDWHRDSRNATWFGQGWDEWKLLTAARPRFDGHRQPRVPLGGIFDEATAEAGERQFSLARRYGIDGFLVDYYWYEDGPYLQRALDEGLLGARNNTEVEFALMWANHELVDIFPHDDPQNSVQAHLADGAISREAFERMVRHIVPAYFARQNYLKVDGRPWFSLYEIGTFIRGMGGMPEALDALAWFDSEVRRAGFPGIHLDAVIWGIGVLPTSVALSDPADVIRQLGFRSATSYVWIHHADMNAFDFPAANIEQLREAAFREYETYADSLGLPFYPNVTVGWDPSPRTDQNHQFVRSGYPWTPTWDPSPGEFKAGLLMARDFLERRKPSGPIVTINAWNEWTEGSALLPDQDKGYGYLEAVRDVFGQADGRTATE